MARFLLDDCVARLVGVELEKRGHDAVPLASLGLRGARDYTVIVAAATEGRILITHNATDYVQLACLWRLLAARWRVPAATGMCPGIITMRQFTRDSAEYARVIDARVRNTSIVDEVHVYRPATGWDIRDCP